MALKQRPRSARGNSPRTQDQVREDLARVRSDEAKRLNVPVSPDLHRGMKRYAVDDGRSIAEITRELWEDLLAGRAGENERE